MMEHGGFGGGSWIDFRDALDVHRSPLDAVA